MKNALIFHQILSTNNYSLWKCIETRMENLFEDIL